MEQAGRAAIVTGGAGGLGSSVVRRLAGAGMAVVVLDRDADGATGDLPASLVSGDTTDDDAVREAIDTARAEGPLSLLVNVAGGGVGGGPTVRDDGSAHSLDAFVATMVMNAFGSMNATRLVAAAMAGTEPDGDGQRGVVVHTSSIAGMEGQRGQVAYAAAKAAILGMTLPMARDLAPLGIRVCAIAPGPMGTPVMRRVVDRLDEDPTEGIAFPARMGDPGEFALLVEAVVRNPYLNGEVIRLDGGLRLQGR